MTTPGPEQLEIVDQKLAQLLSHAIPISLILECLSGVFLDMGQSFVGCTIGVAGYWAGTAMILLRRPLHPSRGDLAYVRFALPIFAIGAVVLYARFGGWAFRMGSMFGHR